MWTFERKMMSMLFNMLSRLVIAFLLRCKRLNFRAAVTICSDFGVQEKKVCHCFHCFPMYFPWSDRTGCSGDLAFIVLVVVLMLSFKPAFLLSFFTFFKRLFSSSSLSAIRVVWQPNPVILSGETPGYSCTLLWVLLTPSLEVNCNSDYIPSLGCSMFQCSNEWLQKNSLFLCNF